MAEITGVPILGHLINRLILCQKLDGIVIATTEERDDDAIKLYCQNKNIPCYRGSKDDVLGRLVAALETQGANTGVIINGDCPIIDPAIIDHMVEKFTANQAQLDFITNALRTTYAPGMEVEVFSFEALKDASARCNDFKIRVHGSLFIRQSPEKYRILNIEAPEHLACPHLELELDTSEDFEVIKKIIENFDGRIDFTYEEIIAFLEENPEIALKNRNVHRRWKKYRNTEVQE